MDVCGSVYAHTHVYSVSVYARVYVYSISVYGSLPAETLTHRCMHVHTYTHVRYTHTHVCARTHQSHARSREQNKMTSAPHFAKKFGALIFAHSKCRCSRHYIIVLCMCVCVHVCMYLCVYAFMCVCIYGCVHTLFMDACNAAAPGTTSSCSAGVYALMCM